MNRIRWWIALAWDWLFSRSCWAETACWGMGYKDGKLERNSDCAGTDCPVGCWCGKFAGREVSREAETFSLEA